MRMLDLFCGAGGAAMGYYRAGFKEIVGVDVHPQNYPFDFVQADAMTYPLDGFDVIHASPPCQAYCALKTMPNKRKHPDLVGRTRDRITASKKPYVIENVPGSPLKNPIILCGSMFGLKYKGYAIKRHRLFEINPMVIAVVPPCSHGKKTIGIYGDKARDIAKEKRHYSKPKNSRGKPIGVLLPFSWAEKAMGIDWMTRKELSQAIPPAYTEFIGKQLIRYLEAQE